MKRALWWTLALGLLLAVPAIPQEGGAGDPAADMAALKKVLAAQEARIAQLEAYVALHKAEAGELARMLRAAEREGFLYPAPNTDARTSLLKGLTRFADTTASGKAPAPESDEG